MKIYIHKILLVIITFISTFVITSSNNITTEFQNIEKDDPIVEVQEKTTIENESDQKELQTEKEKVEESKENKNTTTSITSTTNNSNNNSTNNNVPNNSVKEEVKQETITETKTEESAPIQNNNNQNKSCGIWQSITNCKWDYDTSSACYSAGDHLTELYLNDWMDYNDANPDNPLSRDIKNTECYSVDTDQGTKWYLLVVCYSGTCSKNYKSIYLGK